MQPVVEAKGRAIRLQHKPLDAAAAARFGFAEAVTEQLIADVAAAKVVGKRVAERALAKGVKDVVFDRGGYLYHGRVKALADAAREGGLNF